MSVADAAYIAGFLEADGSITCNHRQGYPNVHHYAVLVVQKDPAILNWIKETVGTGVVSARKAQDTPYKRQNIVWVWTMFRVNDIRAFLPIVLPYMKIKNLKAQGALLRLCIRDIT